MNGRMAFIQVQTGMKQSLILIIIMLENPNWINNTEPEAEAEPKLELEPELETPASQFAKSNYSTPSK